MKIIPIAFDSLGTRAMATYVETETKKIFIDPSVRLAPLRYNLPPHPLELKRKEGHWQEIVKLAQNCDVLIVTHYHYDHHNPDMPELFRNKTVIIKHPTENINPSQKERAAIFLDKIKPLAKKIEIGDNNKFIFKDVKIICSQPVFHGISYHLGYVFETLIDDSKQKFLHTSDVCGLPDESQLPFIIENNPDIIFCDGPSLYLKGYRYSDAAWVKSVANITKVVKETDVKTLVIDHHLTRDLKYQGYYREIKELLQLANSKNRIQPITAAEFLGEENELLEARRKELYAS